ncbi:MAG: terminase large subunit domain-containing protein [Bryobacteraceae bacterium]
MGRTKRICHREIAYQPLPAQQAFHDSTARFKGFSGPIGSGKSQALCQEAIRLTYLNQGRMGLIGSPTYPMLRDSTQTAMLEILDFNHIPYESIKAENALLLSDTQSRIVFRALEDFERLRGTNLAWFGVDELTYTQEEAWLRLEGRLRDPKAKRLCGFGVWTPKGYDWVYRKFVRDQAAGYDCIKAPPSENRHVLDRVPDFYKRLKLSYDDRFYRQEVLGEYVNMAGSRVYTSFSPDSHVTKLAVNSWERLHWALDFNVDPMSSVVAQVVEGQIRVLDEIVLRRATTQEACAEFLQRYPRHDVGVVICGDASGNHQQTTGSTDYDVVKEYLETYSNLKVEYRIAKCNPAVRERVNLVNAKLRSASGAIGLLIDDKCKELIQDFEQVTYKTDGYQIDKERNRMRTHASDALGYLVWQEMKPATPIGEKSGRLI